MCVETYCLSEIPEFIKFKRRYYQNVCVTQRFAIRYFENFYFPAYKINYNSYLWDAICPDGTEDTTYTPIKHVVLL